MADVSVVRGGTPILEEVSIDVPPEGVETRGNAPTSGDEGGPVATRYPL